MSRLNVGIGGILVSAGSDEIRTYALGSCVAVVVWDPSLRVGGMIHAALPEARINPEKARDEPGYFVDTGLPVLFEELRKLGSRPQTCWVKLVGGASILDEGNTFDIGQKNSLAVKQYLSDLGIILSAEDTGGKSSRTVVLSLSTGGLTISNGTQKWTL